MVQLMFKENSICKVGALISRQVAVDLRAFFITFVMAFAAVNNLGLTADRRVSTRASVCRRIGPRVAERTIRTKPTGRDVRTGGLTGPPVS